MQNGKHTQGEWSIQRVEATVPKHHLVYCKIVSSRSDIAFAGVYDANGVILPESECEANAKLIAAAPELLQSLLDIIATNGNIAANDVEWINAIKAIASATE